MVSIQVNPLGEAKLRVAFRGLQGDLLAKDPFDRRLWVCRPSPWKLKVIRTEHRQAVDAADDRLRRSAATAADPFVLRRWQVAVVGAALAGWVVDLGLCAIAPEELAYFCVDLFMNENSYQLGPDAGTVVDQLAVVPPGARRQAEVAALLFAYSEPAEPAA